MPDSQLMWKLDLMHAGEGEGIPAAYALCCFATQVTWVESSGFGSLLVTTARAAAVQSDCQLTGLCLSNSPFSVEEALQCMSLLQMLKHTHCDKMLLAVLYMCPLASAGADRAAVQAAFA